MHSIGIWELGGSGFSIREREDMPDGGWVPASPFRRPQSLDPSPGLVFVGEMWVGSRNETGILGKFC